MSKFTLSFLLIWTSLWGATLARASDIIVTAPSSPQPEIEKLNLEDTLIYTPNVQIRPGSELEHLVGIRSPVLTGGAAAGSFIPYLDDISLRAIGYGNTNTFLGTPYELLSPQLFAGPQTNLGDIVHGAIRYSKQIDSNKETSNNQVRLMSDGQSRYRLDANHESSDRYFAFLGDRSTGWRENSSFYQYKLYYQEKMNFEQSSLTYQFYTYIIHQKTAGYIYGKDSYKDTGKVKSSDFTGAYREAKGLMVQSRFEWMNEAFTLYYRRHEMDFNMHWFPTTPIEENSHYSFGTKLDLVLASQQNSLWAFDVLVERTRGKLKETQSKPTMGGFIEGAHYDYKTTSTYSTAHLYHQWQLSSNWFSQQGLRYSRMRHRYQNNLEPGVFGRYKRASDRVDRYSFLSPYFHLNYIFNPNFNISFNYHGGARSPEVNDIYRLLADQKDEEIPKERIHSFELKSEYSRNGHHLENSLFYMRKTDFYFRDADASNVLGKTEHFGLEGELHKNWNYRFEWGVFWSLSEHRYRFDNTVEAQMNQSESIQKGNNIESSPELQMSSFGSYYFSENNYLTLRWHFVSSYYLNASNTHKYSGHGIWDLAFTSKHKNAELTLAIRNLFDKRYAQRADFFRDEYRYFPGRPRYILGSVAYNF